MHTIRDGVTLHYEVRGDGPPLLLLMGLGAPAEAWEQHVAVYQRHFRCILLDNRGAGDSDRPPGPYTTCMMAEDARAVLDALGIATTAVAGISMGSCIAQELALAHPGRVSRLVLVSSWAHCDAYTRLVFEHFRQMRAISTAEEFQLLLQLWIFAPEHIARNHAALAEARHGAVLTATRRGVANNAMPLGAFAAQIAACLAHDTRDRSTQLRTPTLLTVGSDDIFTPPRLTDELAQHLPDARVSVFAGRGHAHHWEDLDRFNDLTTRFLRGEHAL